MEDDAAAKKRRRLEALMGGGAELAGPSGAGAPAAPAPPAPAAAAAPAPPAAAAAPAPPAASARDAFVVSANTAMSFRLVRTPAELATAPTFHPEFTHQVFREDETIFGYRELKARLLRLRARRSGARAQRRGAKRRSRAWPRLLCRRNPFVRKTKRSQLLMAAPRRARARRLRFCCTRSPSTRWWRSATAAPRPPRWACRTTWRCVRSPAATPQPQPPLPPACIAPACARAAAVQPRAHARTRPRAALRQARLRDAFPQGFLTERSAFEALLLALGPSPPLPPGVTELQRDARSGARVLHAALGAEAGAMRDWHARVAPFVLFFNEEGHATRACPRRQDPPWEVLIALLPATAEGGADAPLLVAGFATVYRVYAWPAAQRLRLSQILVFPPLQRRGAAAALLASVRALALRRDAVDFAVEDPTDELQRLRETADVREARALPKVRAAAAAAVAAAQAAAAAPARRAALELPPRVAEALRAALRLCRAQAGVVWEALLFLAARVRAARCRVRTRRQRNLTRRRCRRRRRRRRMRAWTPPAPPRLRSATR
jgi:hypothetical protein